MNRTTYNDNKSASEDMPGDENDENESVDLTIMSEPLSKVATIALQLEMLLNPLVTLLSSAKKEKRTKEVPALKSAFLKERRAKILELLEMLIELCKSGSLSYIDSLQIKRLVGTFEYDQLGGDVIIDKPRKLLDGLVSKMKLREGELTQVQQIKIMHGAIADLWHISLEDFAEQLTGIQRGVHGASSVSSAALWIQVEAQFGELLLCKPMLVRIDQIARTQGELYTWNISTLIIKILQKTTRRFKVKTILDTITSISIICPTLLKLARWQRITPTAFASIKLCITNLVVEAVSGKGKEQARQLQALVNILQANSALICTGYELEYNGSEPADLVLVCREKGKVTARMVVEVESMPVSQLGTVCAYLKKRYAVKMKTVGVFFAEQGMPLYLMLPIGTKISSSAWKEIDHDDQLAIWKEKLPEDAATRTVNLNLAAIKHMQQQIDALEQLAQKLLQGDLPNSRVRLDLYTVYMNSIWYYMLKILTEDEIGIFASHMFMVDFLRSFDHEDEPFVDSREVVQEAIQYVLDALRTFMLQNVKVVENEK